METKKALYNYCVDFVNQRIESIRQALSSARESADEETKSSSGDKYETGRAMMQIEMENQMIQLQEARKLEDALRLIRPEVRTERVQPGSLVITGQGNFYLTIGIGKISLDEKDYFILAPSSPLGQLLLDKKVSDEYTFNGRTFKITDVY